MPSEAVTVQNLIKFEKVGFSWAYKNKQVEKDCLKKQKKNDVQTIDILKQSLIIVHTLYIHYIFIIL